MNLIIFKFRGLINIASFKTSRFFNFVFYIINLKLFRLNESFQMLTFPEKKNLTIPLKSLPYVFRRRLLELQPISNALVLRQTCSICKRPKFPQAVIPILIFNKDTRLLPRSISPGINMSIINFIPGKEFTAYVWHKLTVVGPTDQDLEELIRLITGPYEELVFNKCNCSNLAGLVTNKVKQFTFTGALKDSKEVLEIFEAVKDVPSIM